MKNLLLLITVVTLLACTKEPEYSWQDLKKISWIEGNWKGMYEGKPFYELYHFTNDSTLEIISYEWNGEDSSHTSRSYLRWADNAYFLGANKNYKVTGIGEQQIYMLPNNKASNDILWKSKDANSWEAILKGSSKENRYLMERVRTFDQ